MSSPTNLPPKEKQFTIRRWVVWSATAGMLVATYIAPTHKFVYPLGYFIVLLSYVVISLAWGFNSQPRKLTIHEEWQIDEILEKKTRSKD